MKNKKTIKMKFKYKHINPVLLKSDWIALRKEINSLSSKAVNSIKSLEMFIERVNELDILICEISERYYVQVLQNSKNKEIASLKKEFQSSVRAPFEQLRKSINSNILNSPFFISLIEQKPSFEVLYKKLKHEHVLKDKDVSDLDKQITLKVDEYDALLAEMTIDIDGKKTPMVFALAGNPDKEKRKAISQKVNAIKQQHANQLHEIFDSLIALRTAKAVALGFPNYRDLKWHENNQTYTPNDTAELCNSIKEVFIPFQKQIRGWRKELLGVDQPKSKTRYFKDIDDLKTKVRSVYEKIHPDFSNFFDILEQHKHLDFDTRKNKSPGWFTSNFPETGVPFVYLLAGNNIQGITITFHETTHAIHHMYNMDRKMLWQRYPDAEAAELFTLTMEFISMEYWEEFFKDSIDLAKAKMEKIEACLRLFRMVALWDRFQTWAFLNPKHSHTERNEYWTYLLKEFSISTDQTSVDSRSWQDRPIMFRYATHMTEYAIATLAALGIYKEFKNNKDVVIERLIKAMKLGNSATLQEIYATAGAEFDFTKEKVKEVGTFLTKEWNLLKLELEKQDR